LVLPAELVEELPAELEEELAALPAGQREASQPVGLTAEALPAGLTAEALSLETPANPLNLTYSRSPLLRHNRPFSVLDLPAEVALSAQLLSEAQLLKMSACPLRQRQPYPPSNPLNHPDNPSPLLRRNFFCLV
jgi:hypothetical protein